MKQSEIQALKDWIISEGLKDFELSAVFNKICTVMSKNFDLYRFSIGMPTLHPLIEAKSFFWSRDTGFDKLESEHGFSERDDWQKSPISYMFDKNLEELHFRLDKPSGWKKYPLLVDLNAVGCTEYYAKVISFNDVFYPTNEDADGMLTSWATTEKDGFPEQFYNALEQILPAFGVVSKLDDRQSGMINIVEAYLGKDAGTRVLEGQIERGDLVSIEAVIWYSDMRHSTPLAEKLSNQQFLDTLNAYFECTAGSIVDNGGEVLRFIGDAVLAIFPFEAHDSPQVAAQSAWQAAVQAGIRINEANKQRKASKLDPLEFGLGLHAGTLDYGNIGVPTRLEFSVIGPVANEVARLEGLTKELGRTVLVSNSFRKLLDIDWQCLGKQSMKGVRSDPVIYAPSESALNSYIV